jgi:hypothetical protein
MRNRLVAILSAAAMALGAGSVASAQGVQRTYVSATGDDNNSCLRTEPCRSFTEALSKTTIGGEVNCINAADYGMVMITRSVTIDCEDTQGTVTAIVSNNGIVINGAGAVVVLRGLSISGGVTNVSGILGIRFIQGASLTLDQVVVTNFGNAASVGLRFEPSNPNAELHIVNSIFANNSEGIRIQPTGIGSANVSLQNVQVINSANSGLLINTQGNTGSGIRVAVRDSQFSSGLTGINVNTPAGTTGVNLSIFDSLIFRNASDGLLGNGPGMSVRVANTAILENGNGVRRVNGALISSYGNNQVFNNGTDGTFSNVLPQQ